MRQFLVDNEKRLADIMNDDVACERSTLWMTKGGREQVLNMNNEMPEVQLSDGSCLDDVICHYMFSNPEKYTSTSERSFVSGVLIPTAVDNFMAKTMDLQPAHYKALIKKWRHAQSTAAQDIFHRKIMSRCGLTTRGTFFFLYILIHYRKDIQPTMDGKSAMLKKKIHVHFKFYVLCFSRFKLFGT